jgi:hypothetical protein
MPGHRDRVAWLVTVLTDLGYRLGTAAELVTVLVRRYRLGPVGNARA